MSQDEINVTQGAPDTVRIAEPDRPLIGSRLVEAVVMALLIGLATVLGWDNVRTGISWQPDGPEAGYFPFYLSVLLGLAALYGLGETLLKSAAGEAFVTRAQFARVLQVFVPSVLFVAATQYLGIYVASFVLVAGFMRIVGGISWWKSLVTALVFALVIFLTFEVAFNVIMPKGPLEAALGF
ncbi:tripartite tricarboxylate transporter TctB family protein [Xanthobacter pseudotagetidis]|uniref:tripartite tricarboxylate transporter TctB family protein n=1 Tax=Xanthobacter pseudotagetidis TaxID=3119911 RepID=UPI00372757CD